MILIIVIILLILSTVFLYYEYFTKRTIQQTIEEHPMIDDRISPDINQGLTVEVLRIRNRSLMEKMLLFGTSWRKTPSFYWTMTVDGKVADSKGYIGLGSSGTFVMWDTIGLETKQNFYIGEEQETSEITIDIVEQEKTGLLGRKTSSITQETLQMIYDFRTGRWSGDDTQMDPDGYGHYLGESYEIWFNIYQADFDHDGIPYWTEVNILQSDPTMDDTLLDPDADGIPTSWEWKWGYDPQTWDDHQSLDPDIDGIENTEEYQLRKYFADPYQPDIYIETDGMEKKGRFDITHIFWTESQQMVIERFAQHGINVYIDDGWDDGPVNGGGEILPFVEQIDDVLGGQIKAFYEHNFADERKGVFRYVLIAYTQGWISPPSYNCFDTINVGTKLGAAFKSYVAFTPRYHRVVLAKKVLHELGHSIGLMPSTFPGNDIKTPVGVRYPNMPTEEYENYLNNYDSIMNYKWMWMDKKLFDYSDGSNSQPYDQNDWDLIYLPTFQIDATSYEESVDESFEDFEVVNDYQGVQLKGWTYDENLTNDYLQDLRNHVYLKNAATNISVFVNKEMENDSHYTIRIYAMPTVSPTHTVWSLVAQGTLTPDNKIHFYSIQNIIDETLNNLEQK